ncbi:hypothetical protein N0V86_009570 [Didymella sp. IMI 355093]|nr:hypothetical protein N0V86_009570 [Didymella sp. IMI 355093]
MIPASLNLRYSSACPSPGPTPEPLLTTFSFRPTLRSRNKVDAQGHGSCTTDDTPEEQLSPHSPTPKVPASQPLVMFFLDLPPEIRNEIYKWLFPTGPSAAQLLARRSGGFIQMSDRFTLLETCRQVYEEVSSLLRGQRRFVVKQPKTLTDVMEANHEEIEAEIIEYVVPKFEIDLHYDLDNGSMSSNGTSILHVSREIRYLAASYANIRIGARVSTTNLGRLEPWIHSGRARIAAETYPFDQHTHLELRTPRTSDENVADLRIDGVELLWATSGLNPFTMVRTVACDEEEAAQEDATELVDVRAGLLLFIHTLIKKFPGGICPEIWLRRDLHVAFADLQLEDGATERVINKHANRSWEQVTEYLIAADIVRHYHKIEHLPSSKETLLSVAKRLADSLAMEFYW